MKILLANFSEDNVREAKRHANLLFINVFYIYKKGLHGNCMQVFDGYSFLRLLPSTMSLQQLMRLRITPCSRVPRR